MNTFTTIVTSGTVTATNRLTQTLPASQNLSYDLNGNLISDGARGYDYDARNQLLRVTATNQWKVEYAYDGFGRRRVRREYSWNGGQWLNASEVHYVYDGMRVVQERSLLNTPTVTYTRGFDLSGTMEGSGGIGGLLARTDAHGSAYYHTDGNGNVTMLVDGSGNMVAKYLYDSYGNTLGMWGSLAAVNTYRFSSKEIEPHTGQYYYGYRFYEPNLQRWLNQDPIREWGGLNLYGFVGNDPINAVDLFGLWIYPANFVGPLKPGDSRMPVAPPNVDVNANIGQATIHFNPDWFYNQVRNHGPWDYKQQGKQYQDFGNFNYGATAAAFGFPKRIICREAGRAQIAAGTSKPGWGDPGWGGPFRLNPLFGGTPPYGDDPDDQKMLLQGIEYYNQLHQSNQPGAAGSLPINLLPLRY